MSVFEEVLNWGPVSRVRRNHGLEHATLQVLAETNPQLRMAGYSDVNGFWLFGEMEMEKIDAAAHEALNRLRAGESNLAVHPHCGTNLVTSGFLAGGMAWLAMLGAGRRKGDRIERLPMVISLVTLAMVVAQPLGPMLQAKVTTSAAADDLEIVSIQRSQRGDTPVHRVLTRG
jgi:hypothetical protein